MSGSIPASKPTPRTSPADAFSPSSAAAPASERHSDEPGWMPSVPAVVMPTKTRERGSDIAPAYPAARAARTIRTRPFCRRAPAPSQP